MRPDERFDSLRRTTLCSFGALTLLAVGCGGSSSTLPGSAGPVAPAQQFLAPAGSDLDNGKETFRFETFGNEGYWTYVVQLPQGMKAQQVTPAQALADGLSFDIDAIPAALASQLTQELAGAGSNPDLTTLPAFNDPANLEALVEANAVLGLSARNVTSLNGTIDIDDDDVFAGESVGASCALCHSITDGSTYHSTNSGTIGKRIDGLTNHNLQFGPLVALALRSRAFYPSLALDLMANNHGSVSRKGPKGPGNPLIAAAPTEQDVDAYLMDPALYPVGMFDDAPDGNGAPVHTTPLFRTDLGAPWGTDGSIHFVQNFGNLVYTALLDPTDLIGATIPAQGAIMGPDGQMLTGAQQFEYDRGGAAGLEIIENYKGIIEQDLAITPYDAANNKNGYPYVGRTDKDPADVATGMMAGVKTEPSPIGMQVNQTKLMNMTAYMNSLHPTPGIKDDSKTIAAGRALFRQQQCTQCHNDDQSKFVPEDIVPYNSNVDLYSAAPLRPDLYPAWNGVVAATRPGPPAAGLVPVRDYPGTFDDKLIIVDPSDYGQPRGSALPALMDLARKPVFLHDDSVRADDPESSLSLLLDPSRGATAPHPFYISDQTQRASVVTFLRSLDDNALR